MKMRKKNKKRLSLLFLILTLLLSFFCLRFFISHSLTPSTLIGFTSSFFCSSTCSLYYTTRLTFKSRWILIKVGSHSLTVLVDTTSSIVYGLIYWSTSFFAGLSLNTKSFVLNIALSLFFHSSLSFLSLSACFFISSCASSIPLLLLHVSFLFSPRTLLPFLLFLSF